MDTENKQPNKKSIWSLVAGIAFVVIGGYRIYNHLYIDTVDYGSFRLILAVVFIGYGVYRIYNYLSTK